MASSTDRDNDASWTSPSPGPPPTAERLALAVAGGRASRRSEAVVVEEPLEIRLGERSLLVTMRTPGHDLDLVRGLLFTEGLVESPEDVAGVAFCRDVPKEAFGNVVAVALREGASLDETRTARAALASAACGVCGKTTLEAVRVSAPAVGDGPELSPGLLTSLPRRMAEQQAVFHSTGGLHAAALFDADGRLLSLREDVGRHNAVDKVIGEAARFHKLPLARTILMISGRAGFEIVQKARRAGIPVLCSVSAPSSLAIDLARDGRQTLVGFLRDGRFNVYAGDVRFRPPLTADPAVPDPEPRP